MTKITDLFSRRHLAQMIDDGYVRARQHPHAPLVIYNYTEKAQYENVWNAVTLICRGLIVNDDTGEVVARPFPKFFNYGQAGAPKPDLDARVYATDKVDGSLGILYPLGDTWAIATRGSFTSEQAQHATDTLRKKYPNFAGKSGVTPLFEIVYPENRIVCDYGDQDDLVLLDVIDNETGSSLSAQWLRNWTGPVVQMLNYKTFGEVLAASPRENAEGIVVHVWRTGERVKIKQDDYVTLHRIITGTSARLLWQHISVIYCAHMVTKKSQWGTLLGIDPDRAEQILATGSTWMSSLLEKVPDEFYTWVVTTADGLVSGINNLRAQIHDDFHQLIHTNYDRKTFALATRGHPHRGALFMLLDGRDITAYVCKAVFPAAELPFKANIEL